MGAGASSDGGELEQLVACTYLLGQALASMSFPDMYRIQDFHAEDAPALRSARGLAADRENAAREAAQPFDYGSRFNVMVSGERIVLDDVARENPDGWTPLHACCHSHATTTAALAIVEARAQPGEPRGARGGARAHNAGWTPLHMAAAYGVEPVVAALLDAGADARCRNSLSWTPLHEACHRGFEPISCLGEAARCGFKDIAVLLLEAGAPKDLANGIGWTPLHEAAFYNHVDVVRSLLVYGADATLRDAQDALAYHVASLGSVRDVLEEMGGELCGNQIFNPTSMPSPADRRRLSPGAAPAPAPDASTPARGGLAAAPPGAPEEFLCAISRAQRPLAPPHGHAFEAKVIRAWFAKNGSICPLTGQPSSRAARRAAEAIRDCYRENNAAKLGDGSVDELLAKAPTLRCAVDAWGEKLAGRPWAFAVFSVDGGDGGGRLVPPPRPKRDAWVAELEATARFFARLDRERAYQREEESLVRSAVDDSARTLEADQRRLEELERLEDLETRRGLAASELADEERRRASALPDARAMLESALDDALRHATEANALRRGASTEGPRRHAAAAFVAAKRHIVDMPADARPERDVMDMIDSGSLQCRQAADAPR
ncbi:hypothetical protein JL720_3685 [Aureococcus anophagefferens]|nr:hypothetical protein JL720_3685 [Aureococcus anophagefferens]